MSKTQWISMEIVEIRPETHSLFNLRLIPVLEETKFNFQAGQCVKVLSPSGHEAYFAMASEPESSPFVDFLLKDQAESAAHALCQLKTGDHVKISLPFGKGFPVERFKGKNIFLIGIGSGLSPLRSVLKSILRRDQQFGKISLLYGARTLGDVPYKNEFDLWAKKINLQIAISQSGDSSWQGFKGRITHLIPKLSLGSGETVACICGTKAMEEEVTNLLERAGVSKDNIFLNH